MNIVGMSKLLFDAFETKEEDEENDPITLNKVDKKNLDRVVKYCEYHKWVKKETDLQVPLPPCEKYEFIKDEFERDFMEKIPIEEVVPLLEVANAMDIPALFELCAATAASQFRGKSYDECKKLFNLEDEEEKK